MSIPLCSSDPVFLVDRSQKAMRYSGMSVALYDSYVKREMCIAETTLSLERCMLVCVVIQIYYTAELLWTG